MSRDIYVQDIPEGIREVSEIPSDFMPEPLSQSHEQIVATIERVAPTADFSDPEWGTIDGDSYSIEVNLKRTEPVRSFAFHVRASDAAADVVIAEILAALGLRAFDIGSDSGLFEPPPAG